MKVRRVFKERQADSESDAEDFGFGGPEFPFEDPFGAQSKRAHVSD